MQFGPDATTEIVVPAGVPFQPGNDVIGIGTQLPIELAQYVPFSSGGAIRAALVFYTSAYDDTSPTSQQKYMWFGMASSAPSQNQSALVMGTCIVANPTVNPIGTIVPLLIVGCAADFAGHLDTYMRFNNHKSNQIMRMTEDNSAGDGILEVYDDGSGSPSGTLP